MAADTRRFRIPGPFVWSGGGNLWITGSRTPTADSAGWRLQVDAAQGVFYPSAERCDRLFCVVPGHCDTLEEAQRAIEAKVARVAASMMVEVEPEEG